MCSNTPGVLSVWYIFQSKVKLRRIHRNKIVKIYANWDQITRKLCQRHAFLCLNLMNYQWVSEADLKKREKWILKENFTSQLKPSDNERDHKIYWCNSHTMLFLLGGDEWSFLFESYICFHPFTFTYIGKCMHVLQNFYDNCRNSRAIIG